MFLNHLNAVEYGVRLLKGWSVKRGSTGASAVKSRMSAAFNVMGSEVSLKTITLPVTIKGRDQHEAAARLSAWEAALAGGKVELQLPDGFLYDAYLKSCGEPSYDLPWLISNTYVLEGVQRGPLLSLKAQPDVPFTVKGTAPRIGCRIAATVPDGADSFSMAGVTFTGVAASDMLCIDGLTIRVLVNGAPGLQKCDIIEWPYLKPGLNTVPGDSAMTVDYYPIYY